MKIRKPIDGLLEERRGHQRWWWLVVPGLAFLAFVIHFVVVGHEVASQHQKQSRDEAHVVGAEMADGDDPMLPPETDGAEAAPTDSRNVVMDFAATPADDDVAEQPEAELADEDKEVFEDEAPPARVTSKAVAPGRAGAVAGKVEKGKTLFQALMAHKFEKAKAQGALNSLSEVFDFRKSRPGDAYKASYDETGLIIELRYEPNAEVRYLAKWDGRAKKYKASKKSVPLEVKTVTIGGTVKSTLFKALQDLGEKNRLIAGFIDRFAYDIDFGSETKPGDTFRILFEKVFLDGKFIRYGYIVAAEYVKQGKAQRIYEFREGNTRTYHDKKGSSLRRMFLRNPVKFSRISSKFGKRFHPILKTHKMHNGVDYAAPHGAPVHSIASGTVQFAGMKGANGNLVAIKHANGYVSYYAHLSKFASQTKVGQKVSQGSVIGYVGSTGRSTGPHLHLGVKSAKGFIDPLSIHSTRGVGLSGSKLASFKKKVREYDRLLDKIKIQPPSEGPAEPPPTPNDDSHDEDAVD